MTFSEKLKESTKVNHQHLEKVIITKLKAIKQEHDYAEIVALFYSYFGALENTISSFIDESALPDAGNRRKSHQLLEDLKAMDYKIPELAEKKNIPQISTYLQALGSLYVMEGSTLGGQIISKMVQEKLSMNDTSKLSFFYGYGAKTHQMWGSFMAHLASVALTEDQQKEIIESANQTFMKFSIWIAQVS